MKSPIRKFGLSLVPAMALAVLFTACGEDGKNGVDGFAEEPGEYSSSSEASGAAPDINPGANSFTGEEGVSSSSVTPGTVPGSNSFTNEENVSSSSATPGTVPGSNSSSSEEDVAIVQTSGYYETNCPAGLDCKYASRTAVYLNSNIIYGEILDTRDGQVYKTIEICDMNNENCQTWMAQNLNYRYVGVKFREGTEYESDSTSWCYENKESFCEVYGRLYTWAAAVDSVSISKNFGEECGFGKSCARFSASALATEPVRGACPLGWHLPSDAEWAVLYKNVDYSAPSLMTKSSIWLYKPGTNTYGFSILPAGVRGYHGQFSQRGSLIDFWSSSEYNDPSDPSSSPQNYVWRQEFRSEKSSVIQEKDSKASGFSVRCLKN